MKAYKGMYRDMICRPDGEVEFKYEEGKTYREEGDIIPCERGFHACLNPLDCISYYEPHNSIYFEVDIDGAVDDPMPFDTKVCGAKITIGKRMSTRDICNAHYEFLKACGCTRTYDGSVVERALDGCMAIRAWDNSYIDVHGCSSVVAMNDSVVSIGSHSAVCCEKNSIVDAMNYTLIDVGSHSVIRCGRGCEVTAGDGSVIHTGNCCYVRAGRSSDIFVLEASAVSSLEDCRIVADNGSIVRAGEGSVITIIDFDWDTKFAKTGIVDNIRLKSDTWYRVEKGAFVDCDAEMKEKGYV